MKSLVSKRTKITNFTGRFSIIFTVLLLFVAAIPASASDRNELNYTPIAFGKKTEETSKTTTSTTIDINTYQLISDCTLQAVQLQQSFLKQYITESLEDYLKVVDQKDKKQQFWRNICIGESIFIAVAATVFTVNTINLKK